MLLRVVNLAQRYGDASIINDLSFRVERGEVVALVGRNGAGKTTALRTVVGLERPAAGEVLFDGEPLDERDPEVRRRLCTLLDLRLKAISWRETRGFIKPKKKPATPSVGESAHCLPDALAQLSGTSLRLNLSIVCSQTA